MRERVSTGRGFRAVGPGAGRRHPHPWMSMSSVGRRGTIRGLWRDGVCIPVSAKRWSAGSAALIWLFKRHEADVLAAERFHDDDMRGPALVQGKTDSRRLKVYLCHGPAAAARCSTTCAVAAPRIP